MTTDDVTHATNAYLTDQMPFLTISPKMKNDAIAQLLRSRGPLCKNSSS